MCLLAGALWGQDAKTETSEESPTGAIQKWAGQEQISATVQIDIKKAPGGLGGAMIVGGGSNKEPFQGQLEVWRPREGGLLITTPREMDGFGVFMRDDVIYVTRTGVAGEEPGLKDVTDALPRLLQADRLKKWAKSAKWTKKQAEDGASTFKAKLTPRAAGLLSTGGGGMEAMISMRGKVLHVEVSVQLDPKGLLKELRVAVVRNSAMANMRAQGGMQVQGLPGGMQLPKEDEEAERTTFRIKPRPRGPSARAKNLHKHFRVLMAQEEEE